MRLPLAASSICLCAVSSAVGAQFPAYTGPKFEKTRLADSVYAFVFDNPLGPAVDGTAVVIINDADVVVVYAQNTPWAARAIIGEIRKLTSNPVRYVVTTHWHGDHWQGNQEYQQAFPGVTLDSLRVRFTGGDVARTRAFDAYFTQPAVERAWLEARGELDRKP